MMRYIKTVALKNYPALRTALRGLTKKHTVNLTILEDDDTVTLSGTSWGGGSRTSYHYVAGNGEARPIPGGRKPFSDPNAATEAPMLGRLLIVSGGTFCGKPACLYVRVRKSDVALFGVTDLLEAGNE